MNLRNLSSANLVALMMAGLAFIASKVEAGNILLGATVIQSSGHHPAGTGFDANNSVIDGAVRDIFNSTYWITPDGGGSTGYFVVDLGSSQQIEELRFRPTSNAQHNDRGTHNFLVRGSNSSGDILGAAPTAATILNSTLPEVNGTGANQIYPTTGFGAPDGLTTGSYRYLRFESITAEGNKGGINEMMARSDTSNLAFGASIIGGSGAYNGLAFDAGSYAAAHVTDGSTSDAAVGGGEKDYWLGSNGVDNEWFKLDLGLTQLINRIDLVNTHNDFHNDRGTRDFNITYSTDDLTYSPLVDDTLGNAAGTGTSLPTESFSFGAVNARYLRFEAETHYGSGAGLNEMLVSIPEPSSIVPLAGLVGAVCILRRRRH